MNAPGSAPQADEALPTPDDVALQADAPAPAAEDPMAPYLAMVGAEGGGNGGHQTGSGAAAPYLEAVGVTPDTANAANQLDAGADDHAAPVPDHDPFAAPDQTEDQVQAIEGAPGEEAPVEQPVVPDADLDPQHHG